MSENTESCPACGARVPDGAEQCDLCGTPVDEPSGGQRVDSERNDRSEPDEPETSGIHEEWDGPAELPADVPDSIFCNHCGWENPPNANYCSQCGSELQEVSSSSSPPSARPVTADLPTGQSKETESGEPSATAHAADPKEEEAVMGRQVLVIVGTALVFVLAMFFVTQWSEQYDWGGNDTEQSGANQAAVSGAQGGAASSESARQSSAPESRTSGTANRSDLETLVEEAGGSATGDMAGRIDSLRALVEDAQGEEKQQYQAELANLLIGAGLPGRAALVQKRLADATGSVEDRRRAADLLYKWMRQLQGQDKRQQVLKVARHVATAYKAVADQRPSDLDARTRMGEAYLLTNTPMRGIQAINAVLEEDSTFVPARFQKGLALLQINRLEEAVKQFELVKQHTESGEPFYKQAERAITVINEQTSTGGEKTSTSASQ